MQEIKTEVQWLHAKVPFRRLQPDSEIHTAGISFSLLLLCSIFFSFSHLTLHEIFFAFPPPPLPITFLIVRTLGCSALKGPQ